MAFINVLLLALFTTVSFASAQDQPEHTIPAVPISIIYLTPNEIKALEAAQQPQKEEASSNKTSQKPEYTEAELLDLEEEIRKQLDQQNLYQNEKAQPTRPPIPIEEPNTEKSLPFTPGYEQHLGLRPLPQLLIQPSPLPAPKPETNYNVVAVPESNLYIKIHKTPNLIIQSSAQEPKRREPEPPKTDEQQWSNKLDIKLPPHQELTDQIKDQVKKLVESNFESHKVESDIRSFLGQLEKENALAKAEAFKKSSPVQVTIKKKNPEPTSGEAKVSQAYIAPLKLIRTLSIPAAKTEKVEAEDQKVDADYQKILSQIAKENALAKAKAYGNIPSVHQLTIKEQKPETTSKHIIIPPSHSYYEHKPIEVKVPQSFDVEIDKPPTYDKLAQVSLSKHVLDNSHNAYLSERFGPKKRVPVEISLQKPQKYTIIRHVWKH